MRSLTSKMEAESVRMRAEVQQIHLSSSSEHSLRSLPCSGLADLKDVAVREENILPFGVCCGVRSLAQSTEPPCLCSIREEMHGAFVSPEARCAQATYRCRATAELWTFRVVRPL